MRAEIETKNDGTGSLHLDGQDVSNGVRGFQFSAAVGEFPRLELDLGIYDGARFAGETDVFIPEQTRDLLVQLGWTPPANGVV